MPCDSDHPDWYYLDRNCYFVAGSDVNGAFSMTWHDARAWCRGQHDHAELASIHNPKEQSLLIQLVKIDSFAQNHSSTIFHTNMNI